MPYSNVPEALWGKMDSCVEQVMEKQGIEKGPAVAICRTQLVPEKSIDEEDMLVNYGGSVKAMGDGRISGYLVKFSDPEHLDLTGEFFDARTDFDFKVGDWSTIYYHHGQDKTLGRRKIGEGAMKIDDVGVWIEGQLSMRDRYEQAIYRMAEAGKMGFSSGTASHLVEREPEGKGVHIKRWPLRLDATITPTPAESSTQVLTLKAYKALEFTEPWAAEPQDDVSQTPSAPVAATKSATPTKTEKKPKQGGIAVDIKRFTIGAMSYAYKIDAEGVRVGDPLFADVKAEAVDQYIVDANKSPSEKALDRVVDKFTTTIDGFAKAFTAQQAATQPGLYATGSHAQVKDALTFGDFLLALHRNDTGALKAMGSFEDEGDGQKVLGDQTGAAGGFTVPTQFVPDLIRINPESEVVWPGGDKLPMSSRSVQVPGMVTTGSTSGQTNTLGGVYVQWTETGTLKPETEPEFTQIELVAHEISAYTEVKEALLQDSAISLDPLLKGLFRDSLMFYTDEAFLDGTGVGQPQGIITAPGTLVLTRTTAGSIVYEDVKTMFMHLLVQAHGGAFWAINQFCMAEIMDMVDPAGNLIWQPNARETIPTSLLGLPIKWTEKTPALGTQGDIILMNPKWYYIGTRQGVSIATSEHYRFRYNRIAYKCVMRLDGQEKLPAPVYAKDGVNQTSPFVVLGAGAT